MKVLPETILYDVDLTISLPVSMTATSGFNAIAHAVEALYAQNRNPLISILALEGIGALVKAMPLIARDEGNASARSDALYGAWACGTCLGSVGMSLHHKVCHLLGGTFDLPHAECHTIMIPHATAYNEQAAATLLRPAAEVLGTTTLAEGLYNLALSLDAPTSLKDIGMPEDGLDEAADQIADNPYWNPRPIERDAVRRMLDNAFHGRKPERTAA